MRRWLQGLAITGLLALAGGASAHKPSDSYLAIEVQADALVGQWDIALRDLDFAIGLDADGDGNITWGEVRARHADIAAYAGARLTLRADGQPCSIAVGTQQLDSLPCVVRCWPDDSLLAVQLQVATLPTAPPARAALCEALLVQALDLIEGDVVGIDTAAGTAVYQRLLALDGLDAPALTAELWDMADAVKDLLGLLPQAA